MKDIILPLLSELDLDRTSPRQDLCAATGTEFEEIVASENHRPTQSMLRSHYTCARATSSAVL